MSAASVWNMWKEKNEKTCFDVYTNASFYTRFKSVKFLLLTRQDAFCLFKKLEAKEVEGEKILKNKKKIKSLNLWKSENLRKNLKFYKL